MQTKPIQVAYVEDDSVTRTIVLSLLKQNGIHVSVAANGKAALDLCTNHPPDIILSDLNMSQMGGMEFLKAIRSNPELDPIYFIMITNQHDPYEVAKALSNGADDYMKKPVSPQELVARIRTGYRMVSLLRGVQEQHQRLLEAERLKVMMESAGAASHHLSQPLTAMILSLERMLEDQTKVPDRESMMECLQLAKWMHKVIGKLQQVDEYRTEPYVSSCNILDIGLDQNLDQWLQTQMNKSKASATIS